MYILMVTMVMKNMMMMVGATRGSNKIQNMSVISIIVSVTTIIIDC